MGCVALADAGVGAVAVGLPFTPVVAENVADLEGFRSLFTADGAGLVVNCLLRAGRGGFQVLFLRHFRRKVVRGKLTILLTANRADRLCLTGRRTAGTADGFLMGCVALADAAVDPVAVGLPFTPVVAENIANLKGFRSFFAADGAGLVVSRLFRAGRGGFQILFFRHFRRKVVRGKLTILLTADRADRLCLTGRRTAGAADGFFMTAVSGADAAVGTVAVGRPVAPVVGNKPDLDRGLQLRDRLLNSRNIAEIERAGNGLLSSRIQVIRRLIPRYANA